MKYLFFDKGKVPLTPVQQRYIKWINSDKKTPFDEYHDDNFVKYAGKVY
jgi:hypothetical protein